MFQLSEYEWSNQKILQKNRKPPRTHFYPFADEETAGRMDARDSARVTFLNGQWDFEWFNSPLCVTPELVAAPPAGKAQIEVPLNWQFAGYGKMWYTDLWYPFPADPPFIPAQGNETGVYKRIFEHHRTGGSLSLRLEGAESAYHVYVNGSLAGYSQGSRMPAEFDITSLAREGENLLCVVVYQYSDGTYLEDQDMWWLGGITRDVLLIERGAAYIDNLVLDPDYDLAGGCGILHVTADVVGGSCGLKIYDGSRLLLEETPIVSPKQILRLEGVSPWNAEEPKLYTIIALARDAEGMIREAVPQRVGFRNIAIEEGVLLLNGRRIMMRGVNRHEFDPKKGRVVTYEQTKKDLLLIKSGGMNAVRTSHYPNNPFFYDLCEELGLYVIDECDLETHGFAPIGQETRLCSDPAWEAAYLDRIERMVERDRNRACVLLWSLGNESDYGPNFKAMYDWCKRNEPTRPVHYEGDFKNQSVDVSSTMYSTVGHLAELDTQDEPKRPHIHCEFAHAMGNGPGSIKEYVSLCEKSERIQGMFVWEFMDQGIYHKREDGKEEYFFGGEFDEPYHNGNFCMDGMLTADRTPSPGFYEYAAAIANVRVEGFDPRTRTLSIRNYWDFLNLDIIELRCTVVADDKKSAAFTLPLPNTAPHESAQVQLPEIDLPPENSDVWLDLFFVMKDAAPWCGAGTQIGFDRVALREARPEALPASGTAPRAQSLAGGVEVTGDGFRLEISAVDGLLHRYERGGKLLIERGPALNFFRAYIDNDAKSRDEWEKNHLRAMQMCVKKLRCEERGGKQVVTVRGRFAPGALAWGCETECVYAIGADGSIILRLSGSFTGDGIRPDFLPKIGTQMRIPKEYRGVTYRGFGPGECYCDSKCAARDGIWSMDAARMQMDYFCPQDNGNRTDVRWAALADDSGGGVAVGASRPLDFSIRDVEDAVLHKTLHSCDLVRTDQWIVNFDLCNTGLGSGSCGPQPMERYRAYTIPFSWELAILPLDGSNLAGAGRRALAHLAIDLTTED